MECQQCTYSVRHHRSSAFYVGYDVHLVSATVVNEPSAAFRIVECNLYSTAKAIRSDINIKVLKVLKGRPSKNHLIKRPFWYSFCVWKDVGL